MRKISKIYVCMHRNYLVYDEEGKKLPEVQECLNSGLEVDRREMVKKIVEDKPSIYVPKWKKISIKEFLFLLGFLDGFEEG